MLTPVALGLTAMMMAAPPHAIARDSARDPTAALMRGRVLAESGDPIRKALVVVAEVGKDPEATPVFTDAEGRFVFIALPPARYVVTASKPGYVTTRFGSRGPFDPPGIVSVADSAVDGVDIRLARAAAISGRVVDDSGDPMLDMTVTASRIIRSGGHPHLLIARSAQTDDLGEYRLSGLAPGTYVVTLASEANMPPAVAIVTGAMVAFSGEPTTSWQPLYHPSTPNISQAQPLTLRTGEETSSIDFAARPEHPTRVSVQIANPGPTPIVRRLRFLADSPLQPPENSSMPPGVNVAATDLLAGEWLLQVMSTDGSSALMPVTVGDTDMSVSVTLSKDARVSGRVVFEGRSTPPPGRVVLEATPSGVPPTLGNWPTAPVIATGAFEFGGFSGPVAFSLSQAPAGWTLKSVSLHGHALADMTATIAPGDTIADAQVVLTNQPTLISGTAVDASGAVARSYSVIVFPDGPARDNLERLSRWVKPDQSGRFSVSDLPPGEYLAIALDEVDDAQWSTAAYLEPLRARATRVTLTAGQTSSMALTVGGSR